MASVHRSNIRSNVRELEGALIRLVAHSSLIGAEITLPYTQQVLKNFIDSQARKVTIESIQKAVAEQFGLRLVEIKAKNNSRSIVYPRQIAMYLAKHLTEASCRRSAASSAASTTPRFCTRSRRSKKFAKTTRI